MRRLIGAALVCSGAALIGVVTGVLAAFAVVDVEAARLKRYIEEAKGEL